MQPSDLNEHTIVRSHPGLHCGLSDNVLQPLLMVGGGFGSTVLLLLFLLLYHSRSILQTRYIINTHLRCTV